MGSPSGIRFFFFSVTAGPLAAKWAYLIDHVRSEENVAKIRGNLFLLNKRKRELARHEGEVATEPALVEKAELMHEISRAQAHLRSCREKTQAAASALEQDIEDCKTREKVRMLPLISESSTFLFPYRNLRLHLLSDSSFRKITLF